MPRNPNTDRNPYLKHKPGTTRAEQRLARNQEYPERWLYSRTKSKAARRGIPFLLKPEDVVIPEYCPALGIRLEYGGDPDSSPSIDRVNNRYGYTKANTVVVSWRANRLKSDCSVKELIEVAKFYEGITHD